MNMNAELAITMIVLFIAWIIAWMLFFDPDDRTTKLRRERKKAFKQGDYEKGHSINKEFDK